MYIYIYLSIYAAVSNKKTEAQAIFLYPFKVCLLCKWKFVIFPFVDEEINGS
jgi:hypothetical protein